jgi:hypothetical protein
VSVVCADLTNVRGSLAARSRRVHHVVGSHASLSRAAFLLEACMYLLPVRSCALCSMQ